ncbi:MAG: UbiA family prenyltransferase [Catenulispora sp.]
MKSDIEQRARSVGAIATAWSRPAPAGRRRPNTAALVWSEARPLVQIVVQLRYWTAVVLAGGAFGVRSALGSLCVLLAYCAVYALNGIADIAEDRRNGSRRPIASAAVAPGAVARLAAGLAAVALAGAATLGWRFLAAAALLLVFGWVYSMPPRPAKKDYRTASAVIFGLGALTYTAGWCAGGQSAISGRLVAVAVAMSLWMVLGGMVKDLPDVAGDREAGRHSWPVAFGDEGSRAIVAVTAAALAITYVAISVTEFRDLSFIALVVAAGAIACGTCAVTPLSRGGRSRARRPYRIFMFTQYAAHVLLLWRAVGWAG